MNNKDYISHVSWYNDVTKQFENLYTEDYVKDLEKRNKELEEGFKASTEELCEYATKVEKAIKYINNNKEHEYRNGNDNEFYLELNEKEMNNLLNILTGEE